jgi:predicted dehydrogenase
MKTLRIAVIGCGYWGPNLIRNFSSTPGVEVEWACDLDQERLAKIERGFKVRRTTTQVTDVLCDDRVDAVVLATPVGTHRVLGEAALRAGKHLWVEKPLAGSVADAEALVAAAKTNSRRLFVDHTFVYTPAVRRIRELVVAGELGDLLYFDSVRVNLGLFQSDSNVLWDLGPHDLSIAQYVIGRRPTEVSAIGVRHFDGEFENLAYVTLKYGDSFIAHFHFNWLAPVKLRMIMIGGSKKMVVYDDLEPTEKVKVYDKGVDIPGVRNDPELRRRALVSYRTGDMWSPRLDQVEALALAAREFVSAINEDRPLVTDGAAGLAVVSVLSAAQRSLELGGQFVGV